MNGRWQDSTEGTAQRLEELELHIARDYLLRLEADVIYVRKDAAKEVVIESRNKWLMVWAFLASLGGLAGFGELIFQMVHR